MLSHYKKCSQYQYDAYIDAYNHSGFKGFEKPIPRVKLGKEFKAFTDNNSILVMEIRDKSVTNIILFSLSADSNKFHKLKSLFRKLPYSEYTFCCDQPNKDKYNNIVRKAYGEKWTEEHRGKVYYYYKIEKGGINEYLSRVS